MGEVAIRTRLIPPSQELLDLDIGHVRVARRWPLGIVEAEHRDDDLDGPCDTTCVTAGVEDPVAFPDQIEHQGDGLRGSKVIVHDVDETLDRPRIGLARLDSLTKPVETLE